MNWQLDLTTRGPLKDERFVFLDTSHATDEARVAQPDNALVTAAHQVAGSMVDALTASGDEVSLSINAHETTEGDGFRPAHITITVSRLDPKRDVL